MFKRCLSNRTCECVLLGLVGAALLAPAPSLAADVDQVQRFTATTTGMEPNDEQLRIDLIRWSSEEERREVVSLLAAPAPETEADTDTPRPSATGRTDLNRALDELPTVGYVWPSNGSVGFSVKYAERVSLPGGGEHITLVTNRRLGAFDLKPWMAANHPREDREPFTVMLLRLDGDGQGDGTMSFAAEPTFDVETGTVRLAGDDQAPILLTARRGQPQD